MSQRPLLFIIIPIPPGLSRGRTEPLQRKALSFRTSPQTGAGIRPFQKRETDCRVALRREASALGVLLTMTEYVRDGSAVPLFLFPAAFRPLSRRSWRKMGTKGGGSPVKKEQKSEFLSSRVRYVPINDIRPNPQQPRRRFDPAFAGNYAGFVYS